MPTNSIGSVERALRERIATALPGPDAQRRFAPVPWQDNWAPDLRPEHARPAAAMILMLVLLPAYRSSARAHAADDY